MTHGNIALVKGEVGNFSLSKYLGLRQLRIPLLWYGRSIHINFNNHFSQLQSSKANLIPNNKTTSNQAKLNGNKLCSHFELTSPIAMKL